MGSQPWIATPWDDLQVQRQVESVIAAGQAPVAFRRLRLGAYKGSTGEMRDQGDWKIRIAIALNLIPPPRVCSVCGETGELEYHAEDYGRPLLIAPMCKGCHQSLHAHFRTPAGTRTWPARVARFGDGTRWFEFL